MSSDSNQPAAMPASEKTSARATGEDVVVHEVDGIQEYDNRLPNWWLYTLYGTVVFAVGYWFAFHEFEVSRLPMAAYRAELAEAARRVGNTKALSDDELVALAQDSSLVEEGKKQFVTLCAPCHEANGGGKIGPNLTDNAWIHGGAPTAIHKTISEGVVAKGMPAWGQQLGPSGVQAVTAFVLSLRDTDVAGGKAAQGEPWDGTSGASTDEDGAAAGEGSTSAGEDSTNDAGGTTEEATGQDAAP